MDVSGFVVQSVLNGNGVTLDVPWLLATVSTTIAALTSAIVAVYRGRIADLQASNTRKDALIDRLLTQLEPLTDATERSVGLAEREHGIRTRAGR